MIDFHALRTLPVPDVRAVRNLEEPAAAIGSWASPQLPVAIATQNDRPDKPRGGHGDCSVAVVAAKPEHSPYDERVRHRVATNSDRDGA